MKRIKCLAAMALTISICLSSTAVFAEGNTLDIDAVMDTAIQNSYTIKSKDIAIKQAEQSYKDAVDNASDINETIDENGRTMTHAKEFALVKSRDNTPAEAKYSIYQNTNAKEVAKNEIALSIYGQYTTLMDAKDTLDTEQKRLDNADAQYKKAKLQLDTGMISQNDFTAAEYSYYKELAAFNKAKRQYKLQTMTINKLIGAPIETEYTTLLKDKITENPYIRTYDSYLSEALTDRAEVLNASEYINLMNFEFKTVKAFYPDTRDDEYKIGKYYVDTAQTSLDTEKIDISLEINTLYNSLQNNVKKLKSQKDSLDYAKLDYDRASQKYNLGLMSKIDLDSKLVTWQDAQNTLKFLQRDIWVAQIKLEYACKVGADTSKLASN
jgi:Outer membrane protein